MKVWKTIGNILLALAAVAGIVFVAVKYGDRIVAWVRKLLCSWGLYCDRGCECDCECDCDECDCEDDCDNCPCECACACDCEAAATEVAEVAEVEEGAVVAEQTDFEG